MKNIIPFFLAILALSCAVYSPQDINQYDYFTQGLPENLVELEEHLSAGETQLGDVRPGAEKAFFWANPDSPEKTEFSLVYIHGYTATRREISPGPELVAQAMGANLFATRLRGHGRVPDSHKLASMNAWLEDTLEALEVGKRIGEKVILVGTSTGGTLVAWLTLGPLSDSIYANILVSPNFGPADPMSGLLLTPLSPILRAIIFGDERTYGVSNELQAAIWDHHHHPDSLVPMMELVDTTKKQDFSGWDIPTLLIHSLEDEVVDQNNTIELFQDVDSKYYTRLVWEGGPDSNDHVIAGEAKDPENTDDFVTASLDFLQALP